MPHRERVMIFDTTLRDGEQSPGCSMAQPEKLRVARALAELGVDVIEAGFPAASRGDWESVNAVAREVQGPIICGLARCNRDDIELVAKAIKPAAKKRIHVFLATSAIHRQFKLNMAQEEIIKMAVEGVKIARACLNSGVVVFDGKDADIWDAPPKPFPLTHCTEQHWVQFQAINKGRLFSLPTEFNWQFWANPDFRGIEDSHFVHLAGVGERCPEMAQPLMRALCLR